MLEQAWIYGIRGLVTIEIVHRQVQRAVGSTIHGGQERRKYAMERFAEALSVDMVKFLGEVPERVCFKASIEQGKTSQKQYDSHIRDLGGRKICTNPQWQPPHSAFRREGFQRPLCSSGRKRYRGLPVWASNRTRTAIEDRDSIINRIYGAVEWGRKDG